MSDASLIVDNRSSLGGAPGLHAILIGVSDYSFLPSADDPPGDGLAALKKLRSSSLSVVALAAKLKALDAERRLIRPLATLRLLHAPSPEELAVDPALATVGGAGATRAEIHKAVRAWRDDAAGSRDSQTLFYFCGHGIRRSFEESILLASDFLDPGATMLFNSFRLSNVRNGMVPGAAFPQIAREQFYFVDACREKPGKLDELEKVQPTDIFDVDLGALDDRKSPIFFATTNGGLAAGRAAEPTYFVNALLWALDNGSVAARRIDGVDGSVWPVSAPSLKLGIERSDALFDSRVELGGLVADPVLCFRRDPPKLGLKVALAPEPLPARVTALSLTEVNRRNKLEITLLDTTGPHALDITAGQYQIAVKPRSKRFARCRSSIEFINIQSQMPWVFDLGGGVVKGVGHVTCEAPESHAGEGPLPVRLRAKTGEIVGTGVTGSPIAVPLGSYFVTILTPDGREVGVPKPVRATAMGTIAPRPADPVVAPVATAPLQSDAPSPSGDVANLPAMLWRGQWLRQWHKKLPAIDDAGVERVDLTPGEARILTHEPDVDRLLVMTLPDRVRCTVIPYDECVVCRSSGQPERSIAAHLNLSQSDPAIDFRSTISEETNTLLRFVELGVLSDMVAVSEDLVTRGEEALLRLDVSVLRAVTGAYVLLRANALDGLERWLLQLGEVSPAVPDLSMLRVELLARLGRHEEAVALMLATIGGQCPWFRAGLSYALERTRLYVAVSDNRSAAFSLKGEDYELFVRARDALELMLPMMVNARYIATFDLPLATS